MEVEGRETEQKCLRKTGRAQPERLVKRDTKPGMLLQTSNPNSWEAEVEGYHKFESNLNSKNLPQKNRECRQLGRRLSR